MLTYIEDVIIDRKKQKSAVEEIIIIIVPVAVTMVITKPHPIIIQ